MGVDVCNFTENEIDHVSLIEPQCSAAPKVSSAIRRKLRGSVSACSIIMTLVQSICFHFRRLIFCEQWLCCGLRHLVSW